MRRLRRHGDEQLLDRLKWRTANVANAANLVPNRTGYTGVRTRCNIWELNSAAAFNGYLKLGVKRLALSRPPWLHVRLIMHQTKRFLASEESGEPMGRLVAAVPALNVLAKHSAKQEKDFKINTS